MKAERVRLVDRFPRLTAADLVARFHPPKRFEGVRFETYVPNPEHPSQAAARADLERFAVEVVETERPPARRWSWRRREAAEGLPGRYLDGGFGVGKTHLLASLWHAAPEPKAYLTFAELASAIGFLGMEAAVAAFRSNRLLCIDEFELDDVANTLMTVTFLRSVVPAGVRVASTSNALPDRLGEGRFHAADFKREIAAIASWFEVVRIDGPDYRATSRAEAEPFPPEALDRFDVDGTVSDDEFDALIAHLRRVHPAQFGALLDGLDAVVIRRLHPIANQGDALLFVHLVDELYDAQVTVAASGCPVEELFPATYRHGGYRTKYGRCESRLLAMLAEARRVA
ncbi:MAG TPA: cell division protein ZapE [Acidimicrobiales bacterium]|nr:cell division protein ZapE [Acidimicrobiales bacterium]